MEKNCWALPEVEIVLGNLRYTMLVASRDALDDKGLLRLGRQQSGQCLCHVLP